MHCCTVGDVTSGVTGGGIGGLPETKQGKWEENKLVISQENINPREDKR